MARPAAVSLLQFAQPTQDNHTCLRHTSPTSVAQPAVNFITRLWLALQYSPVPLGVCLHPGPKALACLPPGPLFLAIILSLPLNRAYRVRDVNWNLEMDL
jgi:hypothetical protein